MHQPVAQVHHVQRHQAGVIAIALVQPGGELARVGRGRLRRQQVVEPLHRRAGVAGGFHAAHAWQIEDVASVDVRVLQLATPGRRRMGGALQPADDLAALHFAAILRHLVELVVGVGQQSLEHRAPPLQHERAHAAPLHAREVVRDGGHRFILHAEHRPGAQQRALLRAVGRLAAGHVLAAHVVERRAKDALAHA